MVTIIKAGDGIINIRAEREQIARERRALDEREKALDVLEKHKNAGVIRLRPLNPSRIAKTPEGLTDAIRSALTTFEDKEFSVREMETYLDLHGVKLPKVEPRSRIAMVFQHLTKKGLIERSYKGSGRDPHRYKVVKK